ncbi:MAG: hypothetical protein J6A19_14675 [Oscillospiraceae bacterium]|nr:hypothetical protein [Oscillospiraceae bacterium]
MADTTNNEKIISLGTLSHNNDKMKEYIQGEIDKIPSSAVDDALSDTSEHPVQNKVITNALNNKAELSDIPSSLPANGGNADTVGDKPISQILAVKGWFDGDMNNLNEPGSYISVGATNRPNTEAWGTVLVFAGGTGSIVQLYMCAVESESEKMKTYIRHYTGNFWTPWVNIADGGNATTLESYPASDFALKTEIPTTLPANGGRSDVANVAYHQVEHFLESGTDVLSYVTSDICPAPFNTIVRIMHSPTCPTNYGYSASDNDFFYHIFKLDNSWATVKAFDIRGNVEFINSRVNGTWTGWVRCNDGGNAATVNGLTVQTAVPANAKFTDTTYGAATASTTGLVSTGAQTFAGNKTFNGQILPAGASDVSVAQARKIYAGTADMTAGTTALETGAIYLVYE